MAQDIFSLKSILFCFIAENVSISDGIEWNEFFQESEEYFNFINT